MASENGWEPAWVGTDRLGWTVVPGTNVKLQLLRGQPFVIMRAFAADFNAYVEPLRDPDSAGYTPTNSVATSNHLNGTAMDLNWDSHPFHVKNTFNAQQQKTIRELLRFYEGTMYWGGDWTNPIDEMHWQMGYNSCNSPKTEDFIKRKIRADGFSTFQRDSVPTTVLAGSVTETTQAEKVLNYNHSQQSVAQEKFFDCCPASTQIVLDGLGIKQSEDELIRAIGTTTDGTNTVEQALPVLNRLTQGKYVATWLPNDPPSAEQRESLWRNVKGSIDAGFGCVLNFEVPSNNFPRGTRGSVSPAYRGSKIWHYVACMGWADDGPGGRHLWIADPGFQPFGYWMSLEQAATAIPPHAYAYATNHPATVTAVPQPTIQPVSIPAGQFASRSGYRTPNEGAIGNADTFTVNDDAMIHTIFVEWSAIELGDTESIYRLVRSAAGRGADTSPQFVKRAKIALTKVPRDALIDTLSRIEQTDPTLLEALKGKG